MRRFGIVLLALGVFATGYHLGFTDCKMRISDYVLDKLVDELKEKDSNTTV